MPALRSRQQELLALKSFAFEERIFPLLEIIKEKDRVNNTRAIRDIWMEYILSPNFANILVDLPTYIRDTGSMSDEVLRFNRTTLSNIERRVEFFSMFAAVADKMIPVVSTLLYKSRETDSITRQVAALRAIFPRIAIRTFTGTFETDLAEINANLTAQDILIYDMDTAQPLNPFVKKQKNIIAGILGPYKIALRSAINTEIQNVKLDHGEVIADADNSLLELFSTSLQMNGFGDYAGIKKDDLSSGGTISPGFIFYDPVENLYYGYKGEVKNLAEFEDTIVPAVLDSDVVQRLLADYPEFVNQENPGYQTLLAIRAGTDSGKSQAKFKRIAMEHYLHCMRVNTRHGVFDQP
ncbi:MAG: hypothetical protein JST75_14860 [Bacteroidetes bacterium]|nr:hypothetical protein [Bacteroidota bacterium]